MRIKGIELFAGAGGMGLGLELAGVDVAGVVELDATACRTLRANLSPLTHVVESDIRVVDGKELRKACGVEASELLVVSGGAPCQPFSKAAYWTEPGDESRYRQARAKGENAVKPAEPVQARPDDRRDLVQEFLRIVEESHADAFLFENVPSITHPRYSEHLHRFLEIAHGVGFETTSFIANAAEYGVPQLRNRFFCLGVRASKPTRPCPTHNLKGEGGLPRAMTASEAFSGLDAGVSLEPEVQINSGRWAEHLKEIPPGWNYKWHTAWAGHPNPTFVTETRFWSFLLKLHPDQPSWTVAASPGPWTGPFHWESRRLTTAELAALQGFPSGYAFCGTRRDRVRQIGNAAPPPLVMHMALAIRRAMGEIAPVLSLAGA
jgi:DNA (cytosine-5)-methyltransferase 1